MTTSEKKIADIIVSLVLVAPLGIWCAWVEKTLWQWFVVPLGVRPIGMAWAYGLTCVAFVFFKIHKTEKTEPNKSPTVAVLTSATTFAVALLAGWVAHKIMGQP